MGILGYRSSILAVGMVFIMAMATIVFREDPAEARGPKVFLACETYSLRDYIAQGKYDYISVMKLM